MKIFTANDARTNFAELMDVSRREPVAITKHGRTVNILLAVEDYERLAQIEDEWWMSQIVATIPSKIDNINIDQSIKEMEKGTFIQADLIKC
jgi:prevent-host-death family protein